MTENDDRPARGDIHEGDADAQPARLSEAALDDLRVRAGLALALGTTEGSFADYVRARERMLVLCDPETMTSLVGEVTQCRRARAAG